MSGRPSWRALWLRSALAGVLAAMLLAPGPSLAESLEEALSAAYQGNPRLRAARAELRGVNEGVPQALSNWRPEVTVSGSVGQQHSSQTFSSTLGSAQTSDGTTPLQGQVEVRQPLYRGGRTVAAVSAAENDVLAERQALVDVEQAVLLDGVRVYADTWLAEAVLELNRNNEERLSRQLQATQDRFQVGEVTRTDVAQSESRLARAVSDRVSSEGELETARARYQEIVGLPPGDIAEPPLPARLPGSLKSVVERALKNNPSVLGAEYARLAADDRVRQNFGSLLPRVDLVGRLSHSENSTTSGTENQQAIVAAEVVIPIYQQGFVSSQVRQSKQVASQRRIEIEQARRAIERQATSAWQTYQTARAQVTSFESEVASAEVALEGVRQENLVGARTVLDVLDAEQELLNAQVNLVTAKRDRVVAAYDLLSAIGGLTAEGLGLPVEIYDPSQHYDKVRDQWFGVETGRE